MRNLDQRSIDILAWLANIYAIPMRALFGVGSFRRDLTMQSNKKATLLTRRQFVAVGALGGVAAAVGCASGRQGHWDFLSDAQGHTLTAICDQIIPADDFPSASQAGVLTYIDNQLVRHFRRHQESYRDGLENAEAISRKRFGRELAALTAPQQLEVVSAIEQQHPDFFNLVRSHTLQGYYGSPRHGGNRNAVSWRMLGLDEPPLRGRAQYDLKKGTHS
jgi:gluconate 2-dehydrogenase gamma chain